MHVHQIGKTFLLLLKQMLVDLRPRNNRAAIECQQFQQGLFPRSQRNPRALATDSATASINDQLPDLNFADCQSG